MATPDKDLRSALRAARTALEILAALARVEYRRRHPGRDCPAASIPSETDLCEWLGLDALPPDDEADPLAATWLDDAESRLAAILGEDRARSLSFGVVEIDGHERFGVGAGAFFGGVTWIHGKWLLTGAPADDAPPPTDAGIRSQSDVLSRMEAAADRERALFDAANPTLPHPLAPIVAAWQDRPLDIEQDERNTAILQGDLFGWVGHAPNILTYPRHDNDVPLRTGYVKNDSTQLALPGLDAPDSQIVTHPALMLVEEAGFGSMTAGSGARKDKVLLVNWLADVELEVRTPRGRYTLRPKLRDIVHRRLWPAPAETGTGKTTRSLWNPSRHAPILRRSMNALTLAGVILDDRREHRPFMVRTLPDFYDLDSRTVVEVAMGELSDRGAMIHRPALTAAGMVSDAAFDGCLALAMLWDRAKAKNAGFRVYATRPAALRDRDGFLTRADGSRITAHAAKPLTGEDGKPFWKAGKVPVRDWRHPQAVINGAERHPAADKVPPLDRNDRRRLFYGHRSDALTAPGRSMAADRASARLRTLATEGRIVIEDCGTAGWRILEAWRSDETSGRCSKGVNPM